MNSDAHSTDPRIEQFWLRYTKVLQIFNIPEKVIPWYRRHVEIFIDDHPDMRLLSHTADTVSCWLEALARNNRVSDWQFLQKVDALRLLFSHLLKEPWTSSFNWNDWSVNTRSLGHDHPKVVRT